MKKVLFCCLLTLVGCSNGGYSSSGTTDNASLGTTSATQPQIKISMAILDASSKQIYSDATTGASLNLRASQTYSLVLTPSSTPPAGIAYSAQLTQTDAVNSPTMTIPLQSGANTFTVANQGDYSIKLMATAPGMIPIAKYYNAAVSCATPSFTQASLDPSKITATAAGSNNLFNISASGVTAGANGMAPYQCAFDPTGTGIIDTAFQSCDTAVTNFYNNNVSTRNVSVIVKDACNTVYTISNNVTYPYSEPAMGAGNVFIFGQLSGASGVAKGDSRVDGVTYLATNAGGNDIVQPNYSNGVFSIQSSMSYGMPSSVKFGMQIIVQGITGTVNVAKGTGSLSAANATLQGVGYSTDQAGDSRAPLYFSGSNCTLSKQQVSVKFQSGQPCSGGTTGDNNMATVEVSGHYVCTGLATTGGATNISGDFDGLVDLVDSCSGGGGGGGGVTPIHL